MRRAFTLVEMAFAVALATLIFGILWSVLGGGLTQSSLNLGRTEALIGGLLAIEHLEQDLRRLALTRADLDRLRESPGTDVSIFATPPGPAIKFLVVDPLKESSPGEGSPDRPLFSSSEVSFGWAPTDAGFGLVLRNDRPLPGCRVAKVQFAPRKVARKGGGNLYFLQTFLVAVDGTGKHRIPLMALTTVRLVTGAQRYPYWNPNPDPVPYVTVK